METPYVEKHFSLVMTTKLYYLDYSLAFSVIKVLLNPNYGKTTSTFLRKLNKRIFQPETDVKIDIIKNCEKCFSAMINNLTPSILFFNKFLDK